MTYGPLDEKQIAARLRTTRVGRAVRVFDELDSTNAYVLAQVVEPADDGLVVLAEYQSAGRGRLGRAWQCPRGAGLLCTMGLVDTGRVINASLLALIVPMAIVDGIAAATGVRAEIKWPNDVVTRRGKLAGVLIESATAPDGAVRYAIGFGINCLQHAGHFADDLRSRATSLDLECAHAIDRTAVLCAVLTELDRYFAAPAAWDAGRVCREWTRRAMPLGGRIVLRHEGRTYSGHAIDIDPEAALIVQLDEGGRRAFSALNTTVIHQSA